MFGVARGIIWIYMSPIKATVSKRLTTPNYVCHMLYAYAYGIEMVLTLYALNIVNFAEACINMCAQRATTNLGQQLWNSLPTEPWQPGLSLSLSDNSVGR